MTAGAGANLLGQNGIADRNQDATCYIGNLEPQTTEEIIWELFLQTGRVGMTVFQNIMEIAFVDVSF